MSWFVHCRLSPTLLVSLVAHSSLQVCQAPEPCSLNSKGPFFPFGFVRNLLVSSRNKHWQAHVTAADTLDPARPKTRAFRRFEIDHASSRLKSAVRLELRDLLTSPPTALTVEQLGLRSISQLGPRPLCEPSQIEKVRDTAWRFNSRSPSARILRGTTRKTGKCFPSSLPLIDMSMERESPTPIRRNELDYGRRCALQLRFICDLVSIHV